MTEFRSAAIKMMQQVVEQRRAEPPVKLATGEVSNLYLDVKGALTTRYRMNLAADAMIQHVAQFKPTSVGGPTMGADVLSHVMVARWWREETMTWYSVRSARKTSHGLGLWIEGARLTNDDRVVIMDDVANSGKSLVEACEHVAETGATIAAICPFVDRADVAELRLRAAGIVAPYAPLMTYADLGIEPLKG